MLETLYIAYLVLEIKVPVGLPLVFLACQEGVQMFEKDGVIDLQVSKLQESSQETFGNPGDRYPKQDSNVSVVNFLHSLKLIIFAYMT